MSTPSQACRVLGWKRLLGAAPVLADCWTAVEIALLLTPACTPLPSRMGEGCVDSGVLRPDAGLQLVPGVRGLLQALVSRNLSGQGLTEERVEGLAPDAVPDRLPP